MTRSLQLCHTCQWTVPPHCPERSRMLILTRKLGESIVIGDDIRIVVLAVGQKSVRLGFDAPLQIVIVREEVLARQNREQDGRDVSKPKDQPEDADADADVIDIKPRLTRGSSTKGKRWGSSARKRTT